MTEESSSDAWDQVRDAVLARHSGSDPLAQKWRLQRAIGTAIESTEGLDVARAYMTTVTCRVPLGASVRRMRMRAKPSRARLNDLQGLLMRARAELIAARAELPTEPYSESLGRNARLVNHLLAESAAVSAGRTAYAVADVRSSRTSRRMRARFGRLLEHDLERLWAAQGFRELVLRDPIAHNLDYLIEIAPTSRMQRDLLGCREVLRETLEAIT